MVHGIHNVLGARPRGSRGMAWKHRSAVAFVCLSLAYLFSPALAAQKSSNLLQSQLRQTYATIKNLARQDLDKPYPKSALWMGKTHRDDMDYDLRADFDQCDGNDRFFTASWIHYEDSPALYLLTNLAVDISRWRKDLKKIGYPNSVVDPAVDDFESKLLSRITAMSRAEVKTIFDNNFPDHAGGTDEDYFGPFEKSYREDARSLVSVLNAFRTKGGKTIPTIIVRGDGCGAGGLTVQITTDPRGAQLSIIPIFFYKLCKIQQLKVNDPDSCDRWREIHDGFDSEVSGDYIYKARWPDGVQREGTLPFNEMGDGKKTLVIHKI